MSENASNTPQNDIVEYRGYSIEVTKPLYAFVVTGPGFSDEDGETGQRGTSFTRLAEAKEAIDGKIELLAKKRRTKIALHVLDRFGKPATVTGIHIGTGKLLGIEHKDGYTAADVFPDVPWIKSLLEERVRLYKRSEEIKRIIHAYRISGMRESRLSRSGGALYDQEIAKLKQDVAEALERAARQVRKDEHAS